jgi:hypothetical protein
MPTLKEVVTTFTKGFTYLNPETGKRNTRLYEFWYKAQWTNYELTKAIEQVVLANLAALNASLNSSGDQAFNQVKERFCSTIAAMVQQVQIQRFSHGDIITSHFQDGTVSCLDRTLCPKKPAHFEKSLIAGLNSVKKSFPELAPLIDNMSIKIKNAVVNPVLVFEESATGNAHNRRYDESFTSSMGDKYSDLKAREGYAREHIKPLGFA